MQEKPSQFAVCVCVCVSGFYGLGGGFVIVLFPCWLNTVKFNASKTITGWLLGMSMFFDVATGMHLHLW